MKFLSYILIGISLLVISAFAQDNSQTLDLRQCIQIALENNIDINSSQNLYKMSRVDAKQAYSNILPQINASLSGGHVIVGPSRYLQNTFVGIDTTTGQILYEQRTITQERTERNSYSANLSVSQNIYDGGRWWNLIRRNRVLEDASDYNLNATQNQVIRTVGQYYFDLLRQNKLLEVDSLAVGRSQDQMERAQQMYEIGSVAQVDVFRARVNLGQDRIAFLNQKNTVKQAEQNLNIAMGRDPHTPIKVDPNTKIDRPLPGLDELINTAFENQPGLMNREKQVRAGELDVSLAKAPFLPSIGASLNYSRQHEEFRKIYTDLDLNWNMSYGVRLSYNLFNGFSDKLNYQRSKIQLKNSQLDLLDFKRNMKATITNLYRNYKSILEIVDINKENLEAAREEYRLANERYRLGSGTSLELRDAQVNLTQAEQILVSAEYSAINTYIELQESVGTVRNLFKL